MKKPYTNNTKGIQHVGSVTVMPGQTREVEESHIKAHFGDGTTETPTPAAAPDNPHALFLSANVKTIKENIDSLSAEDLDAIEALENASDKPRNGVLKAITEARLTLAASPSEVEKFISTLDGMSAEELAELKELYTGEDDSAAYLDAVNTEIENRANSND